MKNSRGFSVIEVLIAIALLAIAMLAIAPLFTTGMRSNAVGWDYSVLNGLAKQRLEEILQYNFADPRLAVPTSTPVAMDDPTQPNDPTKTVNTLGQVYTNQAPLTQSVAGNTYPYPYKAVYLVQDYRIADIPATGNPNPAQAKWDGDVTWKAAHDVKLVTVYALSIRTLQGVQQAGSGLLGSPYSVRFFQLTSGPPPIPIELPGKQIRVSGIKSP